MARFMTAKEAADALGVAVPTIYAYVSRGLIRSEESSESNRTRRYHMEDIERLLAQRETSRNPAKATEEALHWGMGGGMAVLESSLTLITDDAPYYRGYNALQLAQTHHIEQVAALLWTGDLDADVFTNNVHPALAHCLQAIMQINAPYLTPLQAMQMILPLAAAEDPAAYDLEASAVIRSGARIIHLLTSLVIGEPLNGPIAAALATAWGKPQALQLISAALVLCADHELNASSFTARVVAGAGANPYEVVAGALAAFQGIKHGGATERAEAFLRAVPDVRHVRSAVAENLRRGQSLPGFGHPIYLDGVDPRAEKLLALLNTHAPATPTILAVLDAITTINHKPPNIDGALAALVCALDLPTGAAGLLFALGRTTGWIAHALEQYQGRMIRPRARYIGPSPQSDLK